MGVRSGASIDRSEGNVCRARDRLGSVRSGLDLPKIDRRAASDRQVDRRAQTDDGVGRRNVDTAVAKGWPLVLADTWGGGYSDGLQYTVPVGNRVEGHQTSVHIGNPQLDNRLTNAIHG